MKILTLFVLLTSVMLSGCELLKPLKVDPIEEVGITSNKYCESEATNERFDEYCELDTWSDKLILSSSISWPERSQMIEELGEEPKSLLEKVLLSQGEDTPYRNRLRAQKWVEELQTMTDKAMTQVLDILIFQPSQQLLELESAITILSKVNGRQEKTIAEQEKQIAEKNKEIDNQRKQVEQLLDIEASMVNQNRIDSK